MTFVPVQSSFQWGLTEKRLIEAMNFHKKNGSQGVSKNVP